MACLVGALLAGCGGDGGGSGDPVSVSGAWARASVAGQTSGVVYFELESTDDDTLLAANVPASLAGRAEIHETQDDGSGAMTMREVTGGVPIGSGERLSFEPGGLHVMLVDLVAPLAVDTSFELTLEFERGGEVVVPVAVRETAP
jgi:copper(I)-binding protein